MEVGLEKEFRGFPSVFIRVHLRLKMPSGCGSLRRLFRGSDYSLRCYDLDRRAVAGRLRLEFPRRKDKHDRRHEHQSRVKHVIFHTRKPQTSIVFVELVDDGGKEISQRNRAEEKSHDKGFHGLRRLGVGKLEPGN